MTDTKAVMQQALDALKECYGHDKPSTENRFEAISELKAAIAQPAQQTLGKKTIEKLHKFLDASAGDGVISGDVYAADLYIEIFPEQYAEGTK